MKVILGHPPDTSPPRRTHVGESHCRPFFRFCSLLLTGVLQGAFAAGSAEPADGRRLVGTTDSAVPLYVRPRVGLALSGGAAKLFYELGFLAALEREGISIDAIAGTSGGAIVGAYYAYGYSPEERYRKLVEEIDWMGLFRETSLQRERFFYRDPSTQSRGLHIHFVYGRLEGMVSNLFPEGLSGGQRMNNILIRDLPRASLFRDFTLDRLFTPMATVATRVKNPPGGEFRAYSGRLVEAVRSSVEFPLFLPVYFWRENPGPAVAAIDGGVVNNIPIDLLSDASAGTGQVTHSRSTLRLPRPAFSIGVDLTRPVLLPGATAARNPQSTTESTDWLLKFVYGIDIDTLSVERKEEANRDLADLLIRFTLKDETVMKLFDFRKERNRDLYALGERLLGEELPIEIRYSILRQKGTDVVEGPVFVGMEHLFKAGERRAAVEAMRESLRTVTAIGSDPEKSMVAVLDRLLVGISWPPGVRRDPGVLVEPLADRRELTMRFGWVDLRRELHLGLDMRGDALAARLREPGSAMVLEDVRVARNSLMDPGEFRSWLESRTPTPREPLTLEQLRQYAGRCSDLLEQIGLFKVEAVELAARVPDASPADPRGPLAASLIFRVRELDSPRASSLKVLRDNGAVLASLKGTADQLGFNLDPGPKVRRILLSEMPDADGKPVEVHASRDYVLSEFQRLRGRVFNLRETLRSIDDTALQGHYRILKFYLKLAEENPGEVDLYLEVEEKPTSEINLAVRFDLEELYSFYTSYSYSNLGRRGGRLYTDAIYGALTRWRGNLELPLGGRFFGQSELWYGSRKQEVYRDGNAFDSYKEKSVGGVAYLGQRLGQGWWHSGGYRLEWYDLNDKFQARQGGLLPVGDGRLASLVYRHAYSTLDSFPYGTRGFKLDLTCDAARRYLGSRYDYNRLELDTQKPFLLSRRKEHVLNLRTFLGLASGDVPLEDLFGVGGVHDNPFMGFNRRELLGKHYATVSLAHRFLIYRLPVPENRFFFGKLYWNSQVDSGFVADMVKKQGFGTYRQGFGLGLLLDTNFGLVKMMYGINGNRKGQLYLSLGYEM